MGQWHSFDSSHTLLNMAPNGAPHHKLTPKELSEQQKLRALTRAERRRLRRSTPKYRDLHASRERTRVEAFNRAFQQVRELLPCQVVQHQSAGGGGANGAQGQRKMSKIETLRGAIQYLRYLDFLLARSGCQD